MSYLLRIKNEFVKHSMLRVTNNALQRQFGSCPKCGLVTMSRPGGPTKSIVPAEHKEAMQFKRYSSISPTNSYLLSPNKRGKKKKIKKSNTLTEIIEVSQDSSVSETQHRLSTLKAKDVDLCLDTSYSSLIKLPQRNYESSSTPFLFSPSENVSSLSNHTMHFQPATASVSNLENNEIPFIDGEMARETMLFDEDLSLYQSKNLVDSNVMIPNEADLIDNIGEMEFSSLTNSAISPSDIPEYLSKDSDNSIVISVRNNSNSKEAKKRINKEYVLKKEQREHLAKIKREEMEKVNREFSLNKSLVSYLELCAFKRDVQKGFHTLNYYRIRSQSSSQFARVSDIYAYNILLHGFAAQSNIHKVREIFQMMLDDGFKPNCQSFAAIFECMGRSGSSSHVITSLKSTITSLEEEDYELNDLFNKCTYTNDQREKVLQGIRKVLPSFQPVIKPPNMNYICPLLESANKSEEYLKVSPSHGLISEDFLQKKANQQFQMELNGTITVKSVEKKGNLEDLEYFRNLAQETEEKWCEAIQDALERNLNSLSNQNQRHKRGRSINLFPFLNVLSPTEHSKIIIQEIRKLAEGSESYSPTVTQLYRELGTRVMVRYQIAYKKDAKILDKVQLLYRDYLKWYLNPENCQVKIPRQKWQKLLYDPEYRGPHVDIPEKTWPNSVLSSIGRFLYGIIMRDVKINANIMKIGSKSEQIVPAFYSIFRMQGVHLKEEIKPHPALVKLFQAASLDELTFDATLVPMVCPPLPWASIHTGGYLLSAAKIIRLPSQAHQQKVRLESCPQEDLYPSLDSLNQLGAVPWKINHKVLDVVVEVFNNKGDESIGIPSPPSECPLPPHIEPQMSKQEKFKVHKQRLALKRRKAEMFSLRCDALYRLSLANHFRNDIFWFPHNMDFRGRVYPCPPHLNHLGADVARAILLFAKGEPLGPNGLNWLKIHLVNLTGLKKRDCVEDRLKYADEIMDDIIDSADDPLSGRKWWAESEEPWQTLACCIEIANAVRSGDPASYISHFPVHQDGSCNGLQHYAALGRDQAGAESVNLVPSPAPQDVYSAVAALVEKLRQKDAENGVKIAQVLDGFIKRKVIKQTVMTTVYGVTRYGARLQIAKQLKDISDFPKEHLWPASLYLAGRTFDSLQEMFTSTKEIQDWFTECAKLISQVCGQNVEWITPLGLPVVQPYFRPSKNVVDSQDPLKLPELHIFDMYERPNVMKQKNAFPPNFIHSLDSTHMMLTSLHSERSGITFVSVHDCYWTHPCTVEVMNRICREQFVALHSQPILEDLSQFLVDKYSYKTSEMVGDGSIIDMTKNQLNKILSQVPEKGSFNLKSVLDSVYFFS